MWSREGFYYVCFYTLYTPSEYFVMDDYGSLVQV